MTKFIVSLKLVLTLHLISFFLCSMRVATLKNVVLWKPHRMKNPHDIDQKLSFSYITSKNVVYYRVALEVLVEQAICIHVQSCVFIFIPPSPSSNALWDSSYLSNHTVRHWIVQRNYNRLDTTGLHSPSHSRKSEILQLREYPIRQIPHPWA